jgi:carbamoyltransferase
VRIPGINAAFHDPGAAVVVNGKIVAAAEEERSSPREHGKQAVPFSTWELPVTNTR